jgi:hypothetical protein
MLKAFLIILMTFMVIGPTPIQAAPFGGSFSVGLGAGMGDEDVGPGVISGKYWTKTWEVGGEVFLDVNTENTIDQFGLPWALYRHDLHTEDRNSLYAGVGAGVLIGSKSFKRDIGPVLALGWDGKKYGMEFKYGYFVPSTYSIVAYYHF